MSGISYIGAVETNGGKIEFDRVATLTRHEAFSSRAALRPWKTLYNVELPGAPTLKGFSSIAEATRMARKHGATRIVRAWAAQS